MNAGIYHSIRMINTELRLFNFVLIIFLLTISTRKISIDAAAGRCYLCSQNTLVDCIGSIQPNSPSFHTLIQYYTEPCNGQCVLFRNDKTSTVRGCSWTYGHMKTKPTGWHELSPGIQAYFCDSYLCNNGTIEQPNTPMIKTGLNKEEISSSSYLPGNIPSVKQTNLDDEDASPSINDISQQLRQCYVCTAHLTGCGEYLDPHYAAKYIQPCSSSCIIFRNPTDHNLITRDCSTSWPQAHAKSGLHKLLGSDAFFCQESLCNGINFDFIMGIFHNQLPAVIKFSSNPIIEPTLTTTIDTTPKTMATPSFHPIPTPINIDQDNVIWEDPDLDFVVVEPTKTTTTTTPLIPMISTTTSPLPTEFLEDIDIIDESSTIPFEHFDFLDHNSASSTIIGGMAVAEQDSDFNWWDINEASFTLPADFITSIKTTTPPNAFTLISSTIKLPLIDEDDWSIFNTTSVPSVTQIEHSFNSNSDIDFDFNDYFLFPLVSTTSAINLLNNNDNNTLPFVPYYFNDYKPKDQLFDLMKSNPTLDIPPFTWMLQLAKQNNTRKSLINQYIPSTTTLLTKLRQTTRKSFHNHLDYFSQYCNKKQCQNGGRLNADCLCICLPAFSGNNCEKVNCNQEPAHICDFVLEHECKSDYVRYLCPKFCQMNICSSNRSS